MRFRCPHCREAVELIETGDVGACPSCGSEFSFDEGAGTTESLSGRTVGQFECRELLGRGAYGEVWRAWDRVLRRNVAIKVPHANRTTPQDQARLLREARNAAKLHHPGIVAIHEVGIDEGHPYIASELIDGVTLADWARLSQLTPLAAVVLVSQVAEAVQHAHELGIIHRDLKPQNILVDSQGGTHLTDFGMAKHEGAELTIAADGTVLGTIAYMPPEQARGDSHDADARSDVYSLGVILYELLADRRPFEGNKRLIVHQILHEDPPLLRRLRPKLPRDLESICDRALRKDPAARYPSAQALADDLRRFTRGEPVEARPVGRMQRVVRWCRRRPAAAAAIALGAVAVCLAAVLAVRGYSDAVAGLVQVRLDVRGLQGELVRDAEVLWFPLGRGELPQVDQVRRTRSPVDVRLLAGDYLVVASTDDETFHEVRRHVPADDEQVVVRSGNHRQFVRERRGVRIPEVQLFDQASLVEPMVHVDGGVFTVGSRAPGIEPPHRRHVPEYFLDPHEVTVAEYRRTLNQWQRDGVTAADDEPVFLVTWDQAVVCMERQGKRLPTEAEYECAATDHGERDYPWARTGDTDAAAQVTAWTWGPIGAQPLDSIQPRGARSPIFGLYSLVAEWTDSRYLPAPTLTAMGMPDPPPELSGYVVRGGSAQVLDRQPNPTDWQIGPRQRVAVQPYQQRLGVGCRGARSPRPRRLPADFESIVRK